MKDLMDAQGVSQKDLAARLGLSPSFICRVLGHPQAVPDLVTVSRIAQALGHRAYLSLFPIKRKG